MKITFMITLGLGIACSLVILANTINFKSRQLDEAYVKGIPLDSQKVAERLSQAIKLKTISYQQADKFNAEPFLRMHGLIATTFPRVEASLEKN